MTNERASQSPAPRHDCARDDRKLPIDRPCSACGDGDTEMQDHSHCPPFSVSPAPQGKGEDARTKEEAYMGQPGEVVLGVRTDSPKECLQSSSEATDCEVAASPAVSAPELAQKFHEAYERLAPQFGYETRKESAKPWADVPENNRKLMTAVCAEILTDASSVNAALERKLWIAAINAELAQLREWANTEAKRAEAAEARCAELQQEYEAQVECFNDLAVTAKLSQENHLATLVEYRKLGAERDRLQEALRKVSAGNCSPRIKEIARKALGDPK